MRIDRLDLIRFGHFAGREIVFPDRKPDFYVLYGENETGKSTLQRAVSALFFGVPSNTLDTHTYKGPELRLGATLSAAKQSFSFRRRKGTTKTLLSETEAQLPENALAAFFPELDRQRFEQFFALTHERLRLGGQELLHGKGDVGSALFQAAGLLELKKLLKEFEKEAGELFSPRSTGKVIGAAVEEYRTATREMKQQAISLEMVTEKEAALEAAQRALDGLKKELGDLQTERDRLLRIKSNKPDVAQLHELRVGLAALESIPELPVEARLQRGDALSILESATEQMGTLVREIDNRKQRIAQLPLSEVFEKHAEKITDLNRRTGAYRDSLTHLPRRQHTLDQETQIAESAWGKIWLDRPVSDAELVRTPYFLHKLEIRSLITEHAVLARALEKAKQELQRGLEDQQRLQRELEAHIDPPDVAALSILIDQGKSLGDVEQIAAGLKRQIERSEEAAARDLRALPLFRGTTDELAFLKTPLLATIDSYARQTESLANKCKEARARVENSTKTIRNKELEVKTFQDRIGNAAERDLAEARRRRDESWHLIHALILQSDAAQTNLSRGIAESADALTGQIEQADSIADVRFLNAAEAAVHDRLIKEIERSEVEQKALEAEVLRLEQEDQELRQSWTDEWHSLGVEPLSPTEMKEWVHVRQAILDRASQSREKREDLTDLEERIRQVVDQITIQLKRLECPSETSNQSLPVVIKIAEKFVRECEDRRRSRAELRKDLQSLSIAARQASVKDGEVKLREWSQKWSSLVRSLLLSEIATPDHVANALDALEIVFSQFGKTEKTRRQVETIGKDIDNFKTETSELISAIDPALALLPPEEAVAEAHSRLLATREARKERETLEKENASDQRAIETLSAKQKNAHSTLRGLRELAYCDSDEELHSAIAASEDKATKQVNFERIASGLRDRNGVSDLEQIEQEAAAYEFNVLGTQISLIESQITELQEKRDTTGKRVWELQRDYQLFEASNASALQAQKAQDALAKIRPAVNQYLRLRLAAEVVERAIESYRKKHQTPVLRRASELFATLTLGNFSELTTSFGEQDKEVLMAVRSNREKVEIGDGLSDGAVDQLYLALRLAFIEHHVETVAPCPVIFDDILINFDDRRSLATLQVLKGLAQHTQVLFFTHHRRLAELGVQAGAEVVEFSNVATAAIA